MFLLDVQKIHWLLICCPAVGASETTPPSVRVH